MRTCLSVLGSWPIYCVLLLLILQNVQASSGYVQHSSKASFGSKQLTFDMTTPLASLRPETRSFSWISGKSDGTFIHKTPSGSVFLENIATQQREVLLPAGAAPNVTSGYLTNADSTKIVFAVNVTKQYRYSNFANYFVQDVASKKTEPLVEGQATDVQYVAWSPKNPNQMVFVRQNNIFLWDNGKITPITTDGGPELFHGVPDWVYEEEIIEKRFTLWFSPDGKYLAYLSFNDTGVPIYTVPYYMDKDQIRQYPREKKIYYPKAGATNPRVQATVVQLKAALPKSSVPLEKAWAADNSVIGELAWLTDKHSKLIIRSFNRVQNRDKYLLYDVESKTTKIVRERDGTDSWLDNHQAIKYVGKIDGNSSAEYYLDVSDRDGWSHIYLFPVEGGAPKQLTSGKWEVRSVLNYNKAEGTIQFASTESHPTDSGLYTLNLKTGEKKTLSASTRQGYWDASFSSEGGYYVLSYEGPDVPYQELYSLNSTEKPIRVISDNARLKAQLAEYAGPTVKYLDLPHPSGHNLSAMLVFPPNFDPAKKYPVLLTPYGGPGSQEVRKSYRPVGFKSLIVTDPDLGYITFTVDNRGTGYRGRAFRAFLSRNMGVVDVEDQLWALRKLMAENKWVDGEHVGIWGWSNGGYLSAKVVEANSGLITLGLITAPTSDCRLYDSLYTERYMGLPSENAAVYDRAAVRNATGFKNIAGSVLIQHGTGDDNVHFQHTTTMISQLFRQEVSPEKLQVQFFTDSDHGISFGKDSTFLYKQLRMKLVNEKKRLPQPQPSEAGRSQTNEQKSVGEYSHDLAEDEDRIGMDENVLMMPGSLKLDWRLGDDMSL